MHRTEYIALINTLSEQGGTIKDLKRKRSNYSQRVISLKLEGVANKKRKKAISIMSIQKQVIRALSWNQPYASMMLHGKIETRRRSTNVRGKVLICACKKEYGYKTVDAISGQQTRYRIYEVLNTEPSCFNLPKGQAIAIADLVDCRPMTKEDEDICFVEYRPGLYCWVFENVQAIEPFPFKGKQGWSILDEESAAKIKVL